MRVLMQGLAICAGVWVVVAGVQRIFEGMKPSAEKLGALIEDARFADWSGMEIGLVEQEAVTIAVTHRSTP